MLHNWPGDLSLCIHPCVYIQQYTDTHEHLLLKISFESEVYAIIKKFPYACISFIQQQLLICWVFSYSYSSGHDISTLLSGFDAQSCPNQFSAAVNTLNAEVKLSIKSCLGGLNTSQIDTELAFQ